MCQLCHIKCAKLYTDNCNGVKQKRFSISGTIRLADILRAAGCIDVYRLNYVRLPKWLRCTLSKDRLSRECPGGRRAG